ncbi:tetratricopeptide repeat protein [Altererythrobacter indicus]|uniref:Tetratricopeptide repeat protein n=1 Tax=Altericroceibacterium indicum TaxID=374177 RepID=A0A845ACZ9_9SPHN|nr:tetratricopeptide repeat-containing sulfotransferase family protein [Altericroceibacterium indicum]MXP26861.1 tetratricopeptide repeat protein [Altericroceibacterium indicum]
MQQAQTDDRLEAMIQKIQSASMRMTEADAMNIAGQLYAKGRYKQAENICRQLISHKPQLANAHSILGITLNALGRHKDAVASLKKAISLAPKAAIFRSNLGEVQRLQGNLADATVSLIEAIDLDPRNAKAHNNLGIIRFEGRAYDDAVTSYRKAIELNPLFAEAFNNLGNALCRTGEVDAAKEAYQNALLLKENYPEAYANLGTLLRDTGKLDQSEQALRKAIQQKPGYVSAYFNLALTLFLKQADVEALGQLGELFKLQPQHERALVLTARIQLRRKKMATAEQACRMALDVNANNVDALTVLGFILHETDRYLEAKEVLEKAIAISPQSFEAINYYGVTLKSLGQLDDARAHLLRGLEINPHMFGAYSNLSDLIDFTEYKTLYETLKGFAENGEILDDTARISVHFSYGKALEDHGKYEDAVSHYVTAGKLKRKQVSYDERQAATFFADIEKAFPANIFTNRPFDGHSTEGLVFIIGMPRSGSTLVEQIIASHDDAYGAGEVKYLNDELVGLRNRFPSLSAYPDMMRELNPAQWELLADGYEAAIRKHAGDARVTIDKLLTNFFFAGVINLLFPNAKIINTRRDPVDTCLSAFTKLFSDDMPHSYDMKELGGYYRKYDSLMQHWEKVLPKGVMKVVNYEDIVKDTEAQAKEIIEFVGLEWDAKLLDFHKLDRPVRSASVAQVRQPIYQTSLNRRAKYGDALKPLVDAIEKG